jgi:hypothetical protein
MLLLLLFFTEKNHLLYTYGKSQIWKPMVPRGGIPYNKYLIKQYKYFKANFRFCRQVPTTLSANEKFSSVYGLHKLKLFLNNSIIFLFLVSGKVPHDGWELAPKVGSLVWQNK